MMSRHSATSSLRSEGKKRRRVDWSVILEADPPSPRILNRPPPGSLTALLSSFDEIIALEDPDAILRRAVELARERIGLTRVGIFLLDKSRDLMLGTWGSDLTGRLVDEHQIMYAVGEPDREAIRRAEEGAHYTVFDGCPIVEHRTAETVIRGRGWTAFTPIRSARTTIGMMFNDPGLTGAPVDPARQAHAAILCSLLGTVLDASRGNAGIALASDGELTGRRLAGAALALLAKDPTLGGKDIAARLDVSLGRLTREFRAEMGMSLVEYRNRLRLDRFTMLLDTGHKNLMEAALATGFGSYAQFHRVFRARRRVTPRDYLRRHT
jgi:AraC-like DNA-binding protein